MNTQEVCARDRATLDRIVRPAQAVAEMVQAAIDEFLHSSACRRYIERVVHEQLKRLAKEDGQCL